MRLGWFVLAITAVSVSFSNGAHALSPGAIYCTPALNDEGAVEVSCSNSDLGGNDTGGGTGPGDGSTYPVLAKQINAIYQEAFGRDASYREVNHWGSVLDSGQMDLAGIRLSLTIPSIYVGTLERVPQDWEIHTWMDNVNYGGWTLPSMRHAFTQSQECGDKIVSVYQEKLGRTPAAWEVNTWRNNLDGNGWTIDSMRAAF